MPCVCSYPAQPNTWRESVGDGHAVSPEGPAASFATSFRVARRGHAFEGLCWLVSSNNCLDLINRFVAARIRKVKRFQKASLAPLHVRLTSITPQFVRRIAPTARFFHRTRTRLGLLGVPSMEVPNFMFLRTHTNKCLLWTVQIFVTFCHHGPVECEGNSLSCLSIFLRRILQVGASHETEIGWNQSQRSKQCALQILAGLTRAAAACWCLQAQSCPLRGVFHSIHSPVSSNHDVGLPATSKAEQEISLDKNHLQDYSKSFKNKNIVSRMSFENKNVDSRPGHMPGVAVVVLALGLDIFGKYTVKCMPACSQRKHRSYMKSLNVIDSPAKVFVKVISEHWQLLCNGQPPRQWCNGWPQPEKSSNLRAVYVESLGVLDHLGPILDPCWAIKALFVGQPWHVCPRSPWRMCSHGFVSWMWNARATCWTCCAGTGLGAKRFCGRNVEMQQGEGGIWWNLHFITSKVHLAFNWHLGIRLGLLKSCVMSPKSLGPISLWLWSTAKWFIRHAIGCSWPANNNWNMFSIHFNQASIWWSEAGQPAAFPFAGMEWNTTKDSQSTNAEI